MEYSINDYLKYYKDYSFHQEKFNDVDNVLLSMLPYVNMDFIFETKNKVTLKEAANMYFNHYTEEEIENNVLAVRRGIYTLKNMSNCKRYQNLKLYNYVYTVNDETQFGALTIKLPDGTLYIAFEGTDSNVVGWKEDFQMLYMFPVPAQKLAIDYLNNNVKFNNRRVIVGGHSKGGNLALVASMYSKPLIKKKIIKVYNNDGPGLREQEFNSNEYKNLLPKLKHIIPKESFIGLLLNHDLNYFVVDSSAKGFLQHDALTWRCYGSHFIEADLNKITEKRNQSLQKWLQNYDQNERKKIVEALFYAFEKCQITNFKDVKNIKIDEILKVIMNLKNVDEETRKILFKTIKELFQLFKNK